MTETKTKTKPDIGTCDYCDEKAVGFQAGGRYKTCEAHILRPAADRTPPEEFAQALLESNPALAKMLYDHLADKFNNDPKEEDDLVDAENYGKNEWFYLCETCNELAPFQCEDEDGWDVYYCAEHAPKCEDCGAVEPQCVCCEKPE